MMPRDVPRFCKCGKQVPEDLHYYGVCGDCWNGMVSAFDCHVEETRKRAILEGDYELSRDATSRRAR
jgi:hypothetical protein